VGYERVNTDRVGYERVNTDRVGILPYVHSGGYTAVCAPRWVCGMCTTVGMRVCTTVGRGIPRVVGRAIPRGVGRVYPVIHRYSLFYEVLRGLTWF